MSQPPQFPQGDPNRYGPGQNPSPQWQTQSGYPQQGYSQHGYPQQAYSQQPQKKKGGCLKIGLIIFAVLILLVIVLVAIGGGDDSVETENNSSSSNQESGTDDQSQSNDGEIAPPGNQDTTGQTTIRFEAATSDGSSMSVTKTDNDLNISQDNGTASPWSHEFTVGLHDPLNINFSTQQDGSGEVTCKIFVDGQEVVTNTSGGPFSIASCSHSDFLR